MACPLVGTKPLSEPKNTFFSEKASDHIRLDPKPQIFDNLKQILL